MAKRDYYEVLGVDQKRVRRRDQEGLSQEGQGTSPRPQQGQPHAETEFKEANEAYDVLKDADKKAAYDRFGHAAFEGGMGAARARVARRRVRRTGRFCLGLLRRVRRSFRRFHGRPAARRRRSRQRASRGSDLRYNLKISLEDAYSGLQKQINVPTSVACGPCIGTGSEGGSEPVTCPTCSGMGKVRAQQGFFTVERTCPTCSGVGQIVKNPCKTCGGPVV
jgi:molecular chaperone DnaJ